MRGATLGGDPAAIVAEVISIHAPHAGRDQLRVSCDHMEFNFNPRAPCGARRNGPALWFHRRDFNPRAPCGARLKTLLDVLTENNFNPRAPCGARLAAVLVRLPVFKFQSTRPMRGATLGRL